MHFIARYLILAFYVNSRWNGQFLGPFWSREKKSRKLARTSRRPNVATFQRRDVPTSRRLNVVTSQRCDVSANSFSTLLKEKGQEIERRIGKRTDEGTESRAATNQISGEDSCFCIFFFPERLVMFDRLIMCITKSSMF